MSHLMFSSYTKKVSCMYPYTKDVSVLDLEKTSTTCINKIYDLLSTKFVNSFVLLLY